MKQKQSMNCQECYREGVASYQQGNYARAVEYLDQAIKLDPKKATPYINKGAALHALGRHKEAIPCFDTAIKLNPSYAATAYVNKSNALSALGNKKEAIACLDQAIQLDPSNATTYFNKGTALSSLGKKEEAIACLDQAIRLKPNYVSAYVNKGNALSALGKKQEAIASLDQALRLDPDNAYAYCNKGAILSSLGKEGEALGCFEQALKLNPNYVDALHGKGDTLNHLGKNKEALVCFDQALRLDPDNANFYNNKGIALSELGKNEEAIACFEQAIRLKPNNAVFYCNNGKALNDLGREHAALACFNKAYEISSNARGNNADQRSENFVNAVIATDMKAVIKKIAEVQSVIIELEDRVKTLNKDDLKSKLIVQKLNAIKENWKKLSNQTIDNLNKSLTTQAVLKEVENIELLTEVIRDAQNLKANVNEVKEEQKKQTYELEKQAKQLEANSALVKQLMKTSEDMKAQIARDSKISKQDKELLEGRVNSITEKIGSLAKQEDVEAITQEMSKLMGENKITRARLEVIEEDIDSIIERQNQTDERLQKLELFQQTAEKMKVKVASDGKITSKDKAMIESRINAIAEKIESLASKENVEAITQEMAKLMGENKITRARLEVIEEDIDDLISKQEESVEVKIVNHIVYNNPLLNHPELLQDALKHYSLNEILDLSINLKPELVAEAIGNHDSTLILGGIMSLQYN